MTRLEYIAIIKEIVRLDKNPFKEDKPRVRQLFNDLLDSYQKDGIVTEKQASKWYLTLRELNSILRIARGN